MRPPSSSLAGTSAPSKSPATVPRPRTLYEEILSPTFSPSRVAAPTQYLDHPTSTSKSALTSYPTSMPSTTRILFPSSRPSMSSESQGPTIEPRNEATSWETTPSLSSSMEPAKPRPDWPTFHPTKSKSSALPTTNPPFHFGMLNSPQGGNSPSNNNNGKQNETSVFWQELKSETSLILVLLICTTCLAITIGLIFVLRIRRYHHGSSSSLPQARKKNKSDRGSGPAPQVTVASLTTPGKESPLACPNQPFEALLENPPDYQTIMSAISQPSSSSSSSHWDKHRNFVGRQKHLGGEERQSSISKQQETEETPVTTPLGLGDTEWKDELDLYLSRIDGDGDDTISFEVPVDDPREDFRDTTSCSTRPASSNLVSQSGDSSLYLSDWEKNSNNNLVSQDDSLHCSEREDHIVSQSSSVGNSWSNFLGKPQQMDSLVKNSSRSHQEEKTDSNLNLQKVSLANYLRKSSLYQSHSVHQDDTSNVSSQASSSLGSSWWNALGKPHQHQVSLGALSFSSGDEKEEDSKIKS